MIELTEKQHALLAGHEGEPIPVIDPKTDSKYVLLQADVFERWKLALDEDDARLTASILATLDPEDWEDVSNYESKP